MFEDDPLEGQGADEQDAGSGADPAQGSDLSAEVERLKRENAQLRQRSRTNTAKRLASEHGLPEAMVDLLANVPEDKLEKKVTEIAEAWKPAGGAPSGSDEPAPEPEDADALKQMQGGHEGAPPSGKIPTTDPEKQLLERINKAESFEELQALQAELEVRRRTGSA